MMKIGKTRDQRRFFPRSAKESPVNVGLLTTKLDMLVWTHRNQLLRKTIFWPMGVLLAQIFTRAIENGQGLLEHTHLDVR